MARGAGEPAPAAADSMRRALLDRAGSHRSNGLDYQPFHWNTQYAAVLARAGRAAEARAMLEEVRAGVRAEMARVAREGGNAEDLWMSFLFDEAQVLVGLDDAEGARKALGELSAQRPFYRDYVRSDALFRQLF
jgi:hypothetical protein